MNSGPVFLVGFLLPVPVGIALRNLFQVPLRLGAHRVEELSISVY